MDAIEFLRNADEKMALDFLAYVKENQQEESVQFLEALSEYEDIRYRLNAKSRDIYDLYLTPESPRGINLSGSVLEKISEEDLVSPNVFSKAERQAVTLVNASVLPGYVRSERYSRLIREAEIESEGVRLIYGSRIRVKLVPRVAEKTSTVDRTSSDLTYQRRSSRDYFRSVMTSGRNRNCSSASSLPPQSNDVSITFGYLDRYEVTASGTLTVRELVDIVMKEAPEIYTQGQSQSGIGGSNVERKEEKEEEPKGLPPDEGDVGIWTETRSRWLEDSESLCEYREIFDDNKSSFVLKKKKRGNTPNPPETN